MVVCDRHILSQVKLLDRAYILDMLVHPIEALVVSRNIKDGDSFNVSILLINACM